ncbi:Amidohydrolase [Stieleria magnilauensis]|uniref:Amidohydrolase n=2 Tax=Stieleria magnilauensis TaxID=2527963 RepID=A0ABX5XII7_9BACT|nr:Amidohydrolase [Planctomycetes bacterium TBK1r]
MATKLCIGRCLRLPPRIPFGTLTVAVAVVFVLAGAWIAPEMTIAQNPPPQDTRRQAGGEPAASPLQLPLDGRDGRELLLRNFRPNSKLVVPQTPRHSAAMPVVDVHTHFHHRLRDSKEALDDFVHLMDRNNIAICISLDGKLGAQLDHHMEYLWTDYRDRFAIFANIDWQGNAPRDQPALWPCHRPGFADRTAAELERAAKQGVSGLKLFKRFGLRYKNPDGTLIKIDDPRWDPIWAKCGELGLPIIIHTADPAAFFDPIDETNERWEELSRHPDWSFHGDAYPSRRELFEARNRVIARHPNTQFIGAHVANNPEDLKVVAGWLDEYPNLWIEPASRIAELGRQPFTAREFLIRYQDRLLFGTDGPWPETRLRLYWRFFETRDESFPYSEKVPPPQGLWQIYGVDLPDAVLKKLYFENASKLIPGIRQRLEKWTKP